MEILTKLLRSTLLVLLLCCEVRAEEAATTASWSPPVAKNVKAQLDAVLDKHMLSPLQKEQITALWGADEAVVSGNELLERVVTSLAVAQPAAKEIVTYCQTARSPANTLPDLKLLHDETQPLLVRNNLRLLWGTWLARHDMHEEALEQFAGLTPADVVDPASLLFYTAVCHHRLRDKEHCLPALAQLFENEAAVPRRFRELATLMKADLEPLKPDTLDEIARLMDSVRRRLDLGRVGERVREEEDQVIAKLDKLIEQKEKEREEQQQRASSSAKPNPSPDKPLPDSRAIGQKGTGDVDLKDFKNAGNWGNLPPKQRQEVLQQISKDLPSHYREAIEEYFRKLARENDK